MLTSLANTFYFFTETLTSVLEKLQNVPKINDPKPSSIQRPDDKVVIYVRIKDNCGLVELQKMEVKLSDSVEDIKRRCGKGIPFNKMDVSYGKKNMREKMSLSSYGINNGSIVTCQLLTFGVLFIKKHAGRSIMIKVKLSDTVYGIKSAILAASGILPIQQDLRFAGHSLEDNKKISDYGIKNGYTIHLIIVFPISIPNPKMIDFKHNLDFTNMKDEGKVFMRGGWVYKRPYGWNKLALNIKDKYPDTAWLGGTEGLQRTNAVKGEWPVSYHGTSSKRALEIATSGFDLKKGKRFLYGKGIYSTPDPAIAEKYAPVFNYDGKNYKVILQCRVNMKKTVHISEKDYFLTSDAANIRPYGLIFKQIK